jgi:hypothetical protein
MRDLKKNGFAQILHSWISGSCLAAFYKLQMQESELTAGTMKSSTN